MLTAALFAAGVSAPHSAAGGVGETASYLPEKMENTESQTFALGFGKDAAARAHFGATIAEKMEQTARNGIRDHSGSTK
jgi:hypothetical protein